jgi:hypothetical protein
VALAGPTTGTVSGKVTLQGQALPAGVVVFSNTKLGVGASAKLDSTGAYKVDQPLRTGEYEVAVQPPPPPAPHEMPATGAPPAPSVQIPPQYQSPGTSGLKATIKEGASTADFNL